MKIITGTIVALVAVIAFATPAVAHGVHRPCPHPTTTTSTTSTTVVHQTTTTSSPSSSTTVGTAVLIPPLNESRPAAPATPVVQAPAFTG